MKYLTLITFLIIYTLVTPARAEYQSGYNPNEEYNCRYSWGSGKIFYRDKDGKAAPLDFSKDDSDGLKEITNMFFGLNFNFKFAVNGDLIRTSKNEKYNPVVTFHEVIQNNDYVIVANNIQKDHPDVVLNTVIFKNDDAINSVENVHISGIEKGEKRYLSMSWNGRCKRVVN